MDAVTLSRIETEWLVACFYGNSRLIPRDVHERLEVLKLIDDKVTVTEAGKRWLYSACKAQYPKPRGQARAASAAADQAQEKSDSHSRSDH